MIESSVDIYVLKHESCTLLTLDRFMSKLFDQLVSVHTVRIRLKTWGAVIWIQKGLAVQFKWCALWWTLLHIILVFIGIVF